MAIETIASEHYLIIKIKKNKRLSAAIIAESDVLLPSFSAMILQ